MLTPNSRILVTDDVDLMRRMLIKALTDLGYTQIDTAADGQEAQDKLAAALQEGKPFELVFLDWNMPVKTGIEVLEECRAKPEFKDLLMIMVTSEAEQKNVFRALKAGADDYVVKPCNPNIIKGKLEHINKRLAKKAA